MFEAFMVIAILVAAMILMAAKVRYDVVGLGVMAALVILGVITPAQAFSGFSSSAVIVIAAAFVMGNALIQSGALSRFEDVLSELGSPFVAMVVIILMTTLVSAFVSDVATVAIMMPLSVRISKRFGVSPSKFLMPLAFAAILAGRLTIIGSSVNLVILQFVYQQTGHYLSFFSITPLGIVVVSAGLAFLAISWFFLPSKALPGAVEAEGYLTELRVTSDFPYLHRSLMEVEKSLPGRILGTYKGGRLKRGFMALWESVDVDDVLIVRATPEEISSLMRTSGIELVPKGGQVEAGVMQEAVVMPSSPLAGHTAESLDFKSVYGITILGIARSGLPICKRLSKVVVKPGDILLIQGQINRPLSEVGLMPTAGGNISLMGRRDVAMVLVGFLTAIALAAFTSVPIGVDFVVGLLIMIASGAVPIRTAYGSVEWPVIVMIGSFFSLAQAMQASGASTLISSVLFMGALRQPMIALLALYLISMLLANGVNYVAAAMVMAPIAINLSAAIGASPVPFLIDVMMATTTVFLTPISHGANLMVLEPGAYDFKDFFRIGLPLALLLMVVTVLALPLFFPLG
ncbi:MAG: SLC13 family permease [TACK group archaeon]|nr:SLC13 family permease [TACK group archaeon]